MARSSAVALEDPNAACRGPRPALKGEQQITVRLMDDIKSLGW